MQGPEGDVPLGALFLFYHKALQKKSLIETNEKSDIGPLRTSNRSLMCWRKQPMKS